MTEGAESGERKHGCHDGGERKRGCCGNKGGRRSRIERGALRFVLLDALRDGPRHGYDLIKALEERTHGQYVPSAGALYPTLQYLSEIGHVQDTPEGERRVYALTEAGQAEMLAQAERIAAFWADFAVEPVAEPCRHDVRFLDDALEDLSRTIQRGLREAIAGGDRNMVRRVRRVVEQCEEDVRAVIAEEQE